MNLRSITIFVLLCIGCADVTYRVDEEGDGGAGGYTDVEDEVGGFPASDRKEDPQDAGFDPCPEDTYTIWEDENGVRYEVTIEVFCEPVMDMNLGCPAP